MAQIIALRDRFFGRLLVAILVSMAVSEVAVDVIVYYRLRATLEADLSQRLVRTANALSLGLDAQLISQFRQGDEALVAYKLLQARLAEQVRANGVDQAYVVDRDLNTLIASNNATSVGDTHYSLLAQQRQTALAWAGRGTPTPIYVAEEGRLRLTALVPMKGPDGSVTALLGVDAAPEFFLALNELRQEMAILGAASVGVAGLGGVFLIRGAARRLARVRDTVTRASRGDFTASSETRRADQIGALERDLDGLLETIVARVDYYESLLASVDIGLIAADTTAVVVGANATAAKWFGGAQPLIGRSLLAADINAELAAFASEALALRGGGLTRELSMRTSETDGRTLAVVASPLMQGGRRTGTTFSFADVTALRALERQARAQDRLAALGTMAGGLLHEVRTPLGSIMMHLDLLRASVTDGEGLEILDQALGSAERLSRFLVDFQIVAGLRPLRRDWVDFGEAIDAVLNSAVVPDAIVVRRSYERGIAVHADRDLLEHAVRNLFLNAVEAIGTRGAISIRLERSAGEVVLTIQDTGPGVPAELLDRVFDPMFTTKPAGTGLGLTIVTRVVVAHGGSIHVSNAPDGGAVFTTRWPQQEQP